MEKLLQKFNTEYEFIEFENVSIAVLLNKDSGYNFIQFINGLNSFNGGKPIEWVENNLINSFKNILPKKYDKIKPTDIKSKISLVVIFKNIPNPRFEDQIKSKCVNTISTFKDKVEDVDFDKLAKKIFKNKIITNNITEFYDMKSDWEAKKELKNLVKVNKKIKIDKYKPAINEKKYLMVSEGLSAGGAILSATGRDNIGAYPLKGKPLNCYKASIQQIKKNQEVKDILEILGIDLSQDLTKLIPTYENLLIATDADVDGADITMLLLTFFMKYYPDFILQNRVKLLKTPIIISYIKNLPDKAFFNIDDYILYSKENIKHDAKYKKGLASITDTEYAWLFKKGVEPYIETLEWCDNLVEVFDAWMGDDPLKRKDLLVGAEFDIFNS
jgi:DNA gyrase/topoisomerase IV subunit B